MIYAVLSDVHANLEALTAVIEDIKGKKVDKIIFLGDVIGYGPNPNECIDILRSEADIFLAGNHDWTIVDPTEIEYLNPNARYAIEWTLKNITDSNYEFLKTRRLIKRMRNIDILLVHSNPKEPKEWNYITSLEDARMYGFYYFDEKICLIGHTHTPLIIKSSPHGKLSYCNSPVRFTKNSRYIINVGSVGFSRDGDQRASYAILRKGSAFIVRIEYDYKRTIEKMDNLGLL